jgi:hypothetical protein
MCERVCGCMPDTRVVCGCMRVYVSVLWCVRAMYAGVRMCIYVVKGCVHRTLCECMEMWCRVVGYSVVQCNVVLCSVLECIAVCVVHCTVVSCSGV